ncbi:MAG: MFS transporter [Firmicutes bacterium]|nr:MFS transporter [Bacillota bacterium]
MILILSTVPFLMVLGNSMLIPEFPTIKTELQLSGLQVGLLITFFSAPAALVIPFLGYLSDRIGRKIIIVPSLLLYGLGGAVAGFAAAFLSSPYFLILGGRVVQGLGAAGTAPIAMALAGDLFQTKERSESMGILEAANGIGKVLSPIIGSAVALIVWYALFFSYALLSLPVALLIWFFVQEPAGKREKESFSNYLHTIASIFEEKGVSLFFNFLGGLVVLFILFGVLSYVSDLLVSEFHFGGIKKGLLLSVPLLTMSITAYLTGLYLKQKDRFFKLSYFIGLMVVGISMGILPLCCHNLFVFPLILGLLGLGSGLVLPAVNTMVTSAARSEQRGGITSLYGSVRFAGVALGPPAFALLQEVNVTFMFLGSGGLALAAGVLGFLLIREKAVLQPAGGSAGA